MKKYFKILLVLIMFTVMPVFASSTELFRADNSVSVNEELNGTSFIAGNTVDVDSKINGILFAAGNTVTTNGESDYAFIAGNLVRVNQEKFIDGFIAGSTVEINSSEISRDLYVAGANITFDSIVNRDAYLTGDKVTIKGKINGNASIYADEIIIEDNAEIIGTLKYSEDSKITISNNAKIGNTETVKSTKVMVNNKVTIMSIISAKLLSLLNILVIGLALMLLFPKLFEKIASYKKDSILSNLGFGIISLLLIPIASIILLTTMIGVSTGLILLDAYIVCIYLSTIFTSYYLSNILFGEKIKNKYLVFLVGASCITILKLIPFIGVLTSICSLLIGLGLVITLIFKRN